MPNDLFEFSWLQKPVRPCILLQLQLTSRPSCSGTIGKRKRSEKSASQQILKGSQSPTWLVTGCSKSRTDNCCTGKPKSVTETKTHHSSLHMSRHNAQSHIIPNSIPIPHTTSNTVQSYTFPECHNKCTMKYLVTFKNYWACICL